MSVSALLISDDPTLIESVTEVVAPLPNLALHVVPRPIDAFAPLRRGGIALLLVHLPSSADAGLVGPLLHHLATSGHSTPTVVIADTYRTEDVLTLLRQGAADCLGRPLDLHRLSYLTDTLTLRARYLDRSPAPVVDEFDAEELGDEGRFLYPRGGEMGRLMKQVRTIAPQDTTVLLGGETGTGKTCLARLIHRLSPRRAAPFVVVNCGSLVDNLIESELFGHLKGAFTGADRDRVGKFEAVGQGTLLLDEIDALPLPLQAKLLRAVEERIFEPVGSNKLLPFKARLIVASNRELEDEVAAGRFRSDLYYRLNVVAFYLPPLRERQEIIPVLAREFVEKFAAAEGRPASDFSAEALDALANYHWPGNIRELVNAIKRVVALCPTPLIQPEDLPDAVRSAAGLPATPKPAYAAGVPEPHMAGTLGKAKEVAEAARIRAALERHKNNRLRAAAELGISRMTLYKKLHRYGLIS
jgi:DNA-binding NtrC family response regulator